MHTYKNNVKTISNKTYQVKTNPLKIIRSPSDLEQNQSTNTYIGKKYNYGTIRRKQYKNVFSLSKNKPELSTIQTKTIKYSNAYLKERISNSFEHKTNDNEEELFATTVYISRSPGCKTYKDVDIGEKINIKRGGIINLKTNQRKYTSYYEKCKIILIQRWWRIIIEKFFKYKFKYKSFTEKNKRNLSDLYSNDFYNTNTYKENNQKDQTTYNISRKLSMENSNLNSSERENNNSKFVYNQGIYTKNIILNKDDKRQSLFNKNEPPSTPIHNNNINMLYNNTESMNNSGIFFDNKEKNILLTDNQNNFSPNLINTPTDSKHTDSFNISNNNKNKDSLCIDAQTQTDNKFLLNFNILNKIDNEHSRNNPINPQVSSGRKEKVYFSNYTLGEDNLIYKEKEENSNISNQKKIGINTNINNNNKFKELNTINEDLKHLENTPNKKTKNINYSSEPRLNNNMYISRISQLTISSNIHHKRKSHSFDTEDKNRNKELSGFDLNNLNLKGNLWIQKYEFNKKELNVKLKFKDSNDYKICYEDNNNFYILGSNDKWNKINKIEYIPNQYEINDDDNNDNIYKYKLKDKIKKNNNWNNLNSIDKININILSEKKVLSFKLENLENFIIQSNIIKKDWNKLNKIERNKIDILRNLLNKNEFNIFNENFTILKKYNKPSNWNIINNPSKTKFYEILGKNKINPILFKNESFQILAKKTFNNKIDNIIDNYTIFGKTKNDYEIETLEGFKIIGKLKNIFIIQYLNSLFFDAKKKYKNFIEQKIEDIYIESENKINNNIIDKIENFILQCKKKNEKIIDKDNYIDLIINFNENKLEKELESIEGFTIFSKYNKNEWNKLNKIHQNENIFIPNKKKSQNVIDDGDNIIINSIKNENQIDFGEYIYIKENNIWENICELEEEIINIPGLIKEDFLIENRDNFIFGNENFDFLEQNFEDYEEYFNKKLKSKKKYEKYEIKEESNINIFGIKKNYLYGFESEVINIQGLEKINWNERIEIDTDIIDIEGKKIINDIEYKDKFIIEGKKRENRIEDGNCIKIEYYPNKYKIENGENIQINYLTFENKITEGNTIEIKYIPIEKKIEKMESINIEYNKKENKIEEGDIIEIRNIPIENIIENNITDLFIENKNKWNERIEIDTDIIDIEGKKIINDIEYKDKFIIEG